jgi:hypothetical protein
VTDVAEFVQYQRMFAGVFGHKRRRIAAGDPLEGIQKAGPPEPWKTRWKGNPAQVPMWLEGMHRSVTGGGP